MADHVPANETDLSKATEQPPQKKAKIDDAELFSKVPKIAIDRIEICTVDGDEIVLGKGNAGDVVKGNLRNDDGTKTAIAIKRPNTNEKARSEAIVTARIGSHRNIVKFLGVTESKTEAPMLIFDYIENAITLECLLIKYGDTLNEAKKIRILREVVEAIEYLHALKLIHRDIASPNVLVERMPDDQIGRVFLIDFELTKDLGPDGNYKGGEKETFNRYCAAPENFVGRIWTSKSDIFSIGMLIWQMWEDGMRPYVGPDTTFSEAEIIDLWQSGRTLEFSSESTPQSIKDLALKCWQLTEDKRPMAAEVRDMLSKMQTGAAIFTIETNVSNERTPADFMKSTGDLLAKSIGLLESHCHVHLNAGQDQMLFGGTSDPCGYGRLVSINHSNAALNQSVSAALFKHLQEKLGIPPERFYIKFVAPNSSDIGWNGATFEGNH